MAYDTNLEEKIDKLISKWDVPPAKKKTFGGMAYMIAGNMCFGIHKDELILRATEEQGEELLKKPGVQGFDLTGRPMKKWFVAGGKTIEKDDDLLSLLETGRDFALSLPPK